mgnify:CR=1 FL=1
MIGSGRSMQLFFSYQCLAAQQEYSIYIDADFSGTKESSQSIKQGITTALAEVSNEIQGFSFKLVTKNHRANSLRSKKNLEAYLQDENALLIFSGLHSPPLLSNQSFINRKQILVLDPWAAAGPITRAKSNENWIFRLSIDDSNAGTFIVKHAINEGFENAYLLLEDTGWGKSNRNTMKQALNEQGIKPKGISWFNWGIGFNQAKLMLRNIAESGADVILFVGNAPEGKIFSKAMIALPQQLRLPIRSHWGITGGDFSQVITKQDREKLDLQFIQTRFTFLKTNLSIFESSVLTLAKKYNLNIASKFDIKAQTGFVHSYDLTRILIAAINQAGLTGNKSKDKLAIHNALVDLKLPVKGLIKVYQHPFSKYSQRNLNAHEALNINDYTMGYFSKNDSVVLINSTKDY